MKLSPSEGKRPHTSVLYQETLTALQPATGKKYLDGTLGAGGHAEGILRASDPDGQLLGLDVDPQAIEIARERLETFGSRVTIIQASYRTLKEQIAQISWDMLDGIVLDVGASSMQFDTPSRGFSFMREGPLDMRFYPDAAISADDLVNHWDEADLADLIYQYGEEPQSRRISKVIVENRPINSTIQLAEIISQAVKRKKKSKLHPATLTFQALRIAVNDELKNLEETIPDAIQVLRPGGRLAIISFHSLEDRIVKNAFRDHSRDQHDPTHPMNPVIKSAVARLITRKPIMASEEEIRSNPRARSARLRVVEKI